MLECQKRAIKKYVEKNRDKVNQYNRERYNKFKEENTEKYQKILASKKEYYHKRKAQRELENAEQMELNEIKENKGNEETYKIEINLQ